MTAETEDERFERLSRDRIQRPLPKRFYKSVTVTEQLGIALDGRGVKTPLKAPLVLPNHALAEAVAAEWDEQIEVINPHAMPLTKLANTAIDRAVAERRHQRGQGSFEFQHVGARPVSLAIFSADRYRLLTRRGKLARILNLHFELRANTLTCQRAGTSGAFGCVTRAYGAISPGLRRD